MLSQSRENDDAVEFETIIDRDSARVGVVQISNEVPDAMTTRLQPVNNDFETAQNSAVSYIDRYSGSVSTFSTLLCNNDNFVDTTILNSQSDVQPFHEDLEYSSIEVGEDGTCVHEFKRGTGPIQNGLDNNAGMEESIVPHDNGDTFITPPTVRARKVLHRNLGRRRNTEKVATVSDEVLMKQYLLRYLSLLQFLKGGNDVHPHIRVAHCHVDKRSFGFCSALMKMPGEQNSFTGVISVFWQNRIRPRRAICVSFSMNPDTKKIIGVCTCSPLKRQRKDDQSGCFHARVCFDSHVFMEALEGAFSPLQDISTPEEDEKLKHSVFGNYIDVDVEQSQMKYQPVRLTRRQASSHLGAQWMFVLVFDTECQMFTPVLRTSGKPSNCMMCKEGSDRRLPCNHEVACRKKRLCVDESALLDEEDSESDWEGFEEYLGDQQKTRTRYKESDEYYPLGYKRSILPCRGQVQDMRILAHDLELNRPIVLHERGCVRCDVCNTLNEEEPDESRKRKARLYTLAHGARDIDIYDWWCKGCRKLKRFTGIESAVFPAGAGYCYSTELMYHWLNMVSRHNLSFRVAYVSTRSINNSVSMTVRAELNNMSNFDGDIGWNRRRANDAFRTFVKTLDTNTQSVINKLFSCDTCEVPLTSQDCRELGIQESQKGNLKRLRAVVIDGTAAGILQKLPNFERTFLELKPVKELTARDKLIKTAHHRKVVNKLLDMAVEALRESLKKPKSNRTNGARGDNPGAENRERTGSRFWLTKCTDSVTDIHEGKQRMTESEAETALMLCTPNSCACRDPYSESLAIRHSAECEELRKKFFKKKENSEVIKMLVAVFDICEMAPNTAHNMIQQQAEAASNATTVLQPVPDTDSEYSDSESSDGSSDIDDSPESNSSSKDGSDEEEVGLRQPVSISSLWVHHKLPTLKERKQLVFSLFNIIRLLLTGHVAQPYLTAPSEHHIAAGTPSPEDILSFTKDAIAKHQAVTESLRKFAKCEHVNSIGMRTFQEDECSCLNHLRSSVLQIQDANPILEQFCQELIKLSRPLPTPYIAVVETLADLLQVHKETAEHYFPEFTAKFPKECQEYWLTYGKLQPFNAAQNVAGDNGGGDKYGMWFPGRRYCREGVVFNSKDIRQCFKRYTKSDKHSSGLLTVQCTCEKPKLIGFIIMTKTESVALALSALLMHFDILPRVIYYDNACNLFKSALLRVPWILGRTRLAVDRFHYKAHKCSSMFNPDSYRNLDSHRTESAESINARIEKSLPYMRYLGGENLMPFLRVKFALVNLTAVHNQVYDQTDMEDVNLDEFFRNLCSCSCISCQTTEFLNRSDQEEQADGVP